MVMKIKITHLILSPFVICYFRLILIFDLDHFLGDLPYLCLQNTLARAGTNFTKPHTRIKFRPSTPRWSDLMCVHNAAKAALDSDGGRRSILFAANCW